VREIGTLRAIGWSKRMVVRQILAETVVIGVIGALAGVALGIGVGALVGHFSPTLTATSGGVPGLGSSSLSRLLGPAAAATGQGATATTSVVHLTVPVDGMTILLGIALALLGGLVAGAIGGWRAARLQPAVALRDIG
jgi:ABC-type antimicrobial peptide transport system permease subunit